MPPNQQGRQYDDRGQHGLCKKNAAYKGAEAAAVNADKEEMRLTANTNSQVANTASPSTHQRSRYRRWRTPLRP